MGDKGSLPPCTHSCHMNSVCKLCKEGTLIHKAGLATDISKTKGCEIKMKLPHKMCLVRHPMWPTQHSRAVLFNLLPIWQHGTMPACISRKSDLTIGLVMPIAKKGFKNRQLKLYCPYHNSLSCQQKMQLWPNCTQASHLNKQSKHVLLHYTNSNSTITAWRNISVPQGCIKLMTPL